VSIIFPGGEAFAALLYQQKCRTAMPMIAGVDGQIRRPRVLVKTGLKG
jgi:hypothetical protein